MYNAPFRRVRHLISVSAEQPKKYILECCSHGGVLKHLERNCSVVLCFPRQAKVRCVDWRQRTVRTGAWVDVLEEIPRCTIVHGSKQSHVCSVCCTERCREHQTFPHAYSRSFTGTCKIVHVRITHRTNATMFMPFSLDSGKWMTDNAAMNNMQFILIAQCAIHYPCYIFEHTAVHIHVKLIGKKKGVFSPWCNLTALIMHAVQERGCRW